MTRVLLTHGADGEPITAANRRLSWWRAGETVGLSKAYRFGDEAGTEVTDDDAQVLTLGGPLLGGRRFEVMAPKGKKAAKPRAESPKAKTPKAAAAPEITEEAGPDTGDATESEGGHSPDSEEE